MSEVALLSVIGWSIGETITAGARSEVVDGTVVVMASHWPRCCYVEVVHAGLLHVAKS